MPRVSEAKEKLMVAAQSLIWESSYGATSVDDICAKADVRKGSFYHFFKSKSDLAITALEADWQAKKARNNDIFSPTVPPLQRLEDYFALVCERQGELQKEHGSVLGCPYCSLGSEVSLQDEAIREKVQEILGRMVKYFESAIRDAHAQGLIHAPDAKAKAKLIFAYFQGTMTQARIENNLEPLCGLYAGALELLGAGQTVSAAAA
jgi:TetR/AcrR family transcriptional repressor of nem operon